MCCWRMPAYSFVQVFIVRIGNLLENTGPGQQWLNSGSHPASRFPCQRLLRTSLSSFFQGCVPRANRRPLELSSSTSNECVRQRLPMFLLHTEPEQRVPLRKEARGQEVKGCCLELRSFVGEHKLACKTIVLRTYVPSCQA